MVVVVGPVSPYRGGIADTNNAFVQTLIEQGEEVIIFSFSLLYPSLLFPGKSQFLDSDITPNFTSYREINTLNPLSWWNVANRINALKPKAVVFRYWTPWLALCYRTIASRIQSKKIAWIDNALPHERKISDKALLGSFLEGIDEVFCMSKSVAKTVKKHTSKPIHTFFHPINNSLPNPMEKACLFFCLACRFFIFQKAKATNAVGSFLLPIVLLSLFLKCETSFFHISNTDLITNC
ncbi:MAG: hypothetical protein ACPF95_00365 [Flavobacteriaceae bacterium]